KGEGNQQDYGMRIYDPRLGRFLSVDPYKSKYQSYSPYNAFINNPIGVIDQKGDSVFIIAGNGSLYYTYKTAISLPSAKGLQIIQNSSTEHIFITVQDFTNRAAGSGNGAGGVTYHDITNSQNTGASYYSSTTQTIVYPGTASTPDLALFNFNGIDLTRFNGHTISLISINSTFLNDKAVGSGGNDLKGAIELLMHEFLAHISGTNSGDASVEHTNFGATSSMFLGGTPDIPTSKSPADALKKEINNLNFEKSKSIKNVMKVFDNSISGNNINIGSMLNSLINYRNSASQTMSLFHSFQLQKKEAGQMQNKMKANMPKITF
ncbi:MAG: hypothetical protein GXC73_16985, partial [Chitinophagaceae bacterium]|nr:hypothetical protein [Chitinophagaceae bacterium]